jgi:hypothetical protein
MPIGPGKYDDFASIVRVQTDALGVVVIVVGGSKGNGFAVQSISSTFTEKIPELLRVMADQIEKDLKEMKI